MQRAPEMSVEPGQKIAHAKKANDQKVDSLQWFKSFCSKLSGARTGGRNTALAAA